PPVRRPDARMLKSASRLRSEVGRTSRPSGTRSLRPRYLPATMRMGRLGFHALFEGFQEPRTKLITQDLWGNFLHAPFGKGAQLERTIVYAQQQVHHVTEMLADEIGRASC